MGHHALVFGASGILGWAIVNELLNNYPEKGTYSKVTALTNRPLTREEALWPTPGGERPALNIVSGIDLTKGTMEDVRETLKERVPDIDSVTHLYYFGKMNVRLAFEIKCSSHTLHAYSVPLPSRLPDRVGDQSRHAEARLRCCGVVGAEA